MLVSLRNRSGIIAKTRWRRNKWLQRDDHAYRVDGLTGAAGGDHHADSCEVIRAEQSLHGVDDHGRIRQPTRTDVTAREATRLGFDDVDAARIAVIGHSEGGQTAPILAAEGGLAAIVLMAAPGRGILELSHEQFLRGKRLQGASEEELEAFSQAIDDFFARVIADEPIDASTLPAELQSFVGARGWMKSHATQDPAQNIARVPCPVLVLQGEKDIQVSAERDATALQQALEAAGHADFEVVLFPDLDHLFKRSEEEVPTGLEYLRRRPLDPALLDTVAAWLNARLQPSGD